MPRNPQDRSNKGDEGRMEAPQTEIIGPTLANLFHTARAQHQELNKTWIKIAAKVGGRLPASMLLITIQRDGDVDLLLRSIENEMAKRDAAAHQGDMLFTANYLGLMSTYWIGSMYETFRLLRGKNVADEDGRFTEILNALTLIRVPLEKHEIAEDWALKQPLRFVRYPPRNDPSDLQTYDPKDKKRVHMAIPALVPNGSFAWKAFDTKIHSDRWIGRRWISDKVIELWGGDQ
jgi:hypothetical protein